MQLASARDVKNAPGWPEAGCVPSTPLVEALTGRFDDHHAKLARMLLGQIDGLTVQVDKLTARIAELIAAIPGARGVDADGTTGPGAGLGPDAAVLPSVARLDDIRGISLHTAQVIIAEIGLDMRRFPTAGHLVSWAKLTPRTIQSDGAARPARAIPISRVPSARPPQRPP